MSTLSISKLRNTQGFTLIELLIVVVIIGILAAIAIPQFSSTKEKAFDAAAKSDLRNIMTAQEAYFADNQEYHTGTIGTAGGGDDIDGDGTDEISLSEGIVAGWGADATGGFTATASHNQSDNVFCIDTTSDAAEPGEVVNNTVGGC